MRKVRIAVVNSHPIQYFAPLYVYLNRDKELEVTALYCSDFGQRSDVDQAFKQVFKWDIDLLSGYRVVFLGKRFSKRVLGGFWSLIVPEIWSEIRSGSYDVVWLHGYNYAAYIIAFLAAKSKGLPVFMRGETHLRLRSPEWKRRIHTFVLKHAFGLVDAFLAIGSANRQYYRVMGVPDRKIFDMPYTVDNDRFIAGASLTQEERKSVRTRFGLPSDKLVLLYASKFMRRKHPDDLIRAAALLRERGHEFFVFMVGGGEMDAELRILVQGLGLTNVVFGGFVNQAELPRVYAASDVFVLPAENEPWGLTVNEVMCAGLPVLVGDEVGCVPDLVKDEINGYHIKAGNAQSLADALERMLVDPKRRIDMGLQSLTMIRNWSYEQCRVGLLEAVAMTIPHLAAIGKETAQ